MRMSIEQWPSRKVGNDVRTPPIAYSHLAYARMVWSLRLAISLHIGPSVHARFEGSRTLLLRMGASEHGSPIPLSRRRIGVSSIFVESDTPACSPSESGRTIGVRGMPSGIDSLGWGGRCAIVSDFCRASRKLPVRN